MDVVVATRNNTILFLNLIMTVCHLPSPPFFSYQQWSFAGLILPSVLSLNARQFPTALGMDAHLPSGTEKTGKSQVAAWGWGGCPRCPFFEREGRSSGDQGQPPLAVSFKDQGSPCCHGDLLFKQQILVNYPPLAASLSSSVLPTLFRGV